MSLSWYYYRLRTMSLPEIGFRAQQFLQKRKEKKNLVDFYPPEVKLIQPVPRILPHSEVKAEVAEQYIDIFGQHFQYDQPIDWHLDISSGKRFPMSFSKDINIRTEEFGSAKHVWEVNRMQFLTLIALQYRQNKEEKYLEQFQEIMTSWIDANPYLQGVNWYSNIEVNIRLIVWFFCWELLDVNQLMESRADFKSFVEKKWLPCIYLHMQYSFQNPSKYSSANNHLISEHAGLFIASCFWHFEESDHWRVHAQEGLEQEIILQHSKQGVNKEEAAEYIQFITDFFLIPYVVGQHSGHHFSVSYRDQLENICDYIFQMMDLKGNIVYYGDEDDGKVVILNTDLHADNFKSILTSGVILFKNAQWKQQDNGFDTKNAILFGEEGKSKYDQIETSNENNTSKFYLSEGHFILRKQNREENKEVFIHFDAAPLGFLSIAAHGHSDALSFILHIDGYPIIIDSGTYTYHTEAEWRKYFLGALAHNTIRVDETDQAMSAGPTMWLNHFQTKLLGQEKTSNQDMIYASHNGYKKLGVMHHRKLQFDKEMDQLIVTDELLLKRSNQHQIEMPLHLHPSVSVEQLNSHHFLLMHPKARKVELYLPEALTCEVIKGSTKPILGWYSPSFQIKEPTSVIYCKCKIRSTSEFTTQIIILNE
ncbi:alginate lyase family protein [Catalinimonas niigatensis]|uniref:alginate lyase family protein n=1 Tax=Catalinimonas niigatensis TaxID=1397264 RepID=UPI002665101C|nr:alginate lyase family protein [Catalinimonas niigatensis]WPP51361.1 alginate lyase family protein [Catalinimonas niigatensis]